MKKRMLIALALVLSMSAAGCGSDNPENTVVATFVAEETAETAAAEQTVEITMENWEQYFELYPAASPVISPDGRLESWDFSYGVFLKPGYAEHFVSGQVDFELQFELETRKAAIEESTGTYQLGEVIPNDLESAFQQKTFSLEDFRNREDLSVKSEFYGAVAGQAYGGSLHEDGQGNLITEIPVNGKLLHAEGSLTFGNQ